jgi:hypothetical protein
MFELLSGILKNKALSTGFWLPLWYLRFTASDYPSGILDLLFLITSLWYLQTFLYLYISQSNFKKKYWTKEIWRIFFNLHTFHQLPNDVFVFYVISIWNNTLYDFSIISITSLHYYIYPVNFDKKK